MCWPASACCRASRKHWEFASRANSRRALQPKDVILHIIGEIGVDGGTGSVIEYFGSTVRAMDMDSRMTLCNMSIECGARAGMVAPDETTFDYLEGRPMAPQGADWNTAVSDWKSLKTDPGAVFDAQVDINATRIRPSVTYGTHPGMVVAVDEAIPSASANKSFSGALEYMGFQAGKSLVGRIRGCRFHRQLHQLAAQ